jgi:hypothetical protein
MEIQIDMLDLIVVDRIVLLLSVSLIVDQIQHLS